MLLHNCSVLSKGHLSDKTKTRYPGKGSILPSNWNTQEQMASFGAHKPFSPSAREAASLKVSIKQEFYLKMYCPHSPLYTVKVSLSPVWPCTAVWAHSQVHLTQKLPLRPTLLDRKTHHWCQLWKSFRFLANRSCKTNKPCAKWCVATTGPFHLSSLLQRSGDRHALSTSLCITQLSKSLCFLGSFWV